MQSKTLTKLFSGQKLLQLQGRPLALDKNVLTIDPDLISVTRPRLFHSLTRSSSLVKSEGITTPCFCTSTKRVQLNSGNLSSRLAGQEILTQAPAKFFTRRAEEETIQVEAIGWAGQPIVKRLHTILPEVHGDVSDIYKAAKKSKTISEFGNNLDVQVRNFGRSHDIIAVINENARNAVKEKFNVNKTKGRVLHTKNDSVYLRHSGILFRNPPKQKKRKRTVVLTSKPAAMKNIIKRKLHSKGNSKSQKNFAANTGLRIQPTMVMNRQLSTMPVSMSLLHFGKRNFQTFSAPGYAKAKTAVAEQPKKGKSSKSEESKSKKGKSNNGSPSSTISDDDCKCPEILYTTGKRKSTKICGVADSVKTAKKKSTWKPKMCRVEDKEDLGRQKTLICLTEHQKSAKKKKELPKCPEPEIKILPRVIICEPNLIDEEEAKKKKECIKIEEVKIRKRTKVCKPVIIFAKEEIGITAEKKAVCTSTRVKKVVSRHTKICPPVTVK